MVDHCQVVALLVGEVADRSLAVAGQTEPVQAADLVVHGNLELVWDEVPGFLGFVKGLIFLEEALVGDGGPLFLFRLHGVELLDEFLQICSLGNLGSGCV